MPNTPKILIIFTALVVGVFAVSVLYIKAAQEALAPDAILASTNLNGVVGDVQDDPDSPDTNWLTAVDASLDTDARLSFPAPSNDLQTGADLQEFRVLLRRTNNSTREPDATISLYEGGTAIATLVTNQVITSTAGEVLSATWDAASLNDPTGAGVEIFIEGASTGGRNQDRNTVEIGAVEWNAETADPSASLPTVTTTDASGITSGQATGNGEITNTGGEDADERGFVWDTVSRADPGNTDPASSAYVSTTNETGTFATGTFSLTLPNLTASTTYFYRAYAHNSAGYSYGSEISFTTLEEISPASWLAEENNATTTEKNTNIRLRMQIANEGNIADAAPFQLEYSDSTAGPWVKVPVDSGCSSTAEAFIICSSDNFSNDAPTTQRLSTTGVESFDFVSGYIMDGSNPAPEISFSTSTFTEVEWNIQATASAEDGGSYFFRVSNPGNSIGTYSEYPQLNIAADGAILSQEDYRWYESEDNLTPSTSWDGGSLAENTVITENDNPPAPGDNLRLRMSLNNASGADTLGQGTQAFNLEYGEKDGATCGDIVDWNSVGATSSAEVWRFAANPSVSSGTTLTSLLLANSDVAGTYEEQNPSASNPNDILADDYVEYDWSLEHNGANPASRYCFRMVKSGGTELSAYNNHPETATAPFAPETQNWQWFGDAENETPTQDLAATNTSPTDIKTNDPIKLRITAEELLGVTGEDVKFRLQVSESSTFSDGGIFIDEIGECTATSTWCYADGGGEDNATITTRVLTDSDTNGTHNESGISTSTYTHTANSAVEYEFTIKRAEGASMNTTYFFRLYDTQQDSPVEAGSTKTFPSLSTEGATLSFEIQGLPSGTSTEGVTTDIGTSPTEINFQTLDFGTEVNAAQRKVVTTNAANGYQIFVYQLQSLLNPKAETIPPITATNDNPDAWTTACDLGIQSGCYGYHAGDDILSSGDTERFSAIDSFARLEEEPKEIAFSGGPVENRATDIVFRNEISPTQPSGTYATELIYIVVPVF